MSVELVISAILWTTLAVIISQGVSIVLMRWLGLPPSKLVREIVDVQNTAVGACFFIISLGASIFVSLMTSAGFTPDPPALESALWIVGGVVVAMIYTAIMFVITHRILGVKKGEGVVAYMRREIVTEQNAALALFLGGLAITPFIAVALQLI
jgi:hypothetical protein